MTVQCGLQGDYTEDWLFSSKAGKIVSTERYENTTPRLTLKIELTTRGKTEGKNREQGSHDASGN